MTVERSVGKDPALSSTTYLHISVHQTVRLHAFNPKPGECTISQPGLELEEQTRDPNVFLNPIHQSATWRGQCVSLTAAPFEVDQPHLLPVGSGHGLCYHFPKPKAWSTAVIALKRQHKSYLQMFKHVPRASRNLNRNMERASCVEFMPYMTRPCSQPHRAAHCFALDSLGQIDGT
jgi:hypothetical protein